MTTTQMKTYSAALAVTLMCFAASCAIEFEDPADQMEWVDTEWVDQAEQDISVAADSWCSCVNYMFRRYTWWGQWGPGSAKDYGSWLESNHNYTKVSSPSEGDVVIMQPGFSATPVDGTHGHIARVAAVMTDGSERRVLYQGANQPGLRFSQFGCSNVTYEWTDYHSTSDSNIAYYRH